VNPGLDLLARLRDAHAPPDPSWWPPAPGWWIAFALAAALAVIVLRHGPPWWRRWRRRRRLLAALEAAASAAEVSRLLRLAALERFPELAPAGLQGAAWLEFLEARDRAPGRFAGLHAALTEAPYGAHGGGGELAPLRDSARGWLRAVL
jgi:Domain of unknown function (DUF4381)